MDEFPKWARDALADSGGRVSHGLNLVLELDDPAGVLLPRMLWDIVVAQDKIKSALERLSFVHYARFVPSWDGRALMVITEFDGPLDPYVLDFVIALGDVFDTLLSYVKQPPEKMPVREHPTEFLAWVKQWNRVPFSWRSERTLFPVDYDYPLYSAYPDKTVTDIAGPRLLPPPTLDGPAAAVDPADVQGNILRGYRAMQGRYLFFRIADATLARRWLARELPRPNTPWKGVASAMPWPAARPDICTQVALTAQGLALLLPDSRKASLATFPTAFTEGAAARAKANHDLGTSAPDTWLFGRSDTPVHVVLFLYTLQEPVPAAFLEAVAALEGGLALGLVHQRTLCGAWRGGSEPFGFADGISDPAISGQCPDGKPAFQPASSPGEFLLHRDYASIYGGSSLGDMPQGLAGNGSFGVLRLMEQDVERFNESTASEATRLGVNAERLRAKLVGRWKNGAPLALAPEDSTQAGAVNAFDYGPSWEFPEQVNDHAGLRCPVGAHVRRANPRTARVAGQPHSRRLLRRGMPAAWQEDGRDKVGLMGLFMGANIEQQFEFIQQQWLQGDLAASGVRGTSDAIAAIRSEPTDFPFLEPDPDCPQLPRRLVARIPPLIRTRGCLYLLFPGISALKALDAEQSALDEALRASAALADAARAFAEAGIVAVEQGAQQLAGGAIAAAAQAGATAGDLLDDFVGDLGTAAGQAAQAGQEAIASVVAAAPAVQAHLPGIDVSRFLGPMPPLDVLYEMPELQPLADGQWKQLLKALTERHLDSPFVKTIVESFLPATGLTAVPEGVPVVDLDLADPRFCAQPQETLCRLRELEGKRMVWVPAQQACWVLDHAGCAELLAAPERFGQQAASTPLSGIVTLDPPRHAEVRGAFATAFRAALAALERPTSTGRPVIDALVEAQVGRISAQPHLQHFDFMRDLAVPTARAVVWQLVGVKDPAERKACDALAHTMMLHYGKKANSTVMGDIPAGDAGLRLAACLGKHLSWAWLASFVGGGEYKGTLIGELAARMNPVRDTSAARPLGFLETLITLVQTVVASQSPHFLLGTATLHLLSPDARPGKGDTTPWTELAALAATPASRDTFDTALRQALGEALRFEPPLTMVERYARGPQRLFDVDMPAGCAVFAMVASANRDSRKYGANAEAFHIDRDAAAGHLSLGHGIHLCAGRALQERLVPAAMTAAIRAFPQLRLSNPTAVPAWQPTLYFRALQALPVATCAARPT